MVALIMILFIASGLHVFSTDAQENTASKQHNEKDSEVVKKSILKAWEQGPLIIDVVLQQQYIDNQQVVNTKNETIWSLEDFWAAYEDWDLVKQEEGEILFVKEINDLSPIIKARGYFGLDEQGKLTIFEGKPAENKVIQSFYQINTKELESSKTNQLRKGIKVKSKEQYLSLLETYKTFSLSNKK